MILADSSVWIDYLADGDAGFEDLLSNNRILCHPYVIGEVSLGSLGRQRKPIMNDIYRLPMLMPARHSEVMTLIDNKRIYSRGIGYVDMCLLAAVTLRPGTTLVTRDKRLRSVASELGVSAG